MNLLELGKTLGIPESGMRDALYNIQISQEQLREHAASLQAHNAELEAYTHTVAHNLKNPLAALVITSDLITDVPDLTCEEVREYLEQIRSIAYEMDSIIDNLLLLSEARHQSQGDARYRRLELHGFDSRPVHTQSRFVPDSYPFANSGQSSGHVCQFHGQPA